MSLAYNKTPYLWWRDSFDTYVDNKIYRIVHLRDAYFLDNMYFRGKEAAVKGKKKGGLLSTIGNIAEGALYGMEKGAKAFNDGVGSNDWNVPKQSDVLVIPKGNNNLFFEPEHKKKYERDW